MCTTPTLGHTLLELARIHVTTCAPPCCDSIFNIDIHTKRLCEGRAYFIQGTSDKSPEPLRHLLWSLRTLEAGVWPSCSVDGSPLDCPSAGTPLAEDDGRRWSAITLFVKGDLEYFANDLGLPHWASRQCCGLCLADKGPFNYKDMRRFKQCDDHQIPQQ